MSYTTKRNKFVIFSESDFQKWVDFLKMLNPQDEKDQVKAPFMCGNFSHIKNCGGLFIENERDDVQITSFTEISEDENDLGKTMVISVGYQLETILPPLLRESML